MIRTLILLLTACLASATAPAAVRKPVVDWSRISVRNADGTITVGNPKARIKLVEYLSLTCPHCGQVAREADAPLRADYIRTGRLSFTVQHALRDGTDMAGSMLARCTAPRGYFDAVARILGSQETWFPKAAAYDAPDLPEGASPTPRLIGMANAAGFPALLGLPPARVATCLGDAREQKLLSDMARRIWTTPGFPGTPVFVINGHQENSIRSWAELEAKLKSAK